MSSNPFSTCEGRRRWHRCSIFHSKGLECPLYLSELDMMAGEVNDDKEDRPLVEAGVPARHRRTPRERQGSIKMKEPNLVEQSEPLVKVLEPALKAWYLGAVSSVASRIGTKNETVPLYMLGALENLQELLGQWQIKPGLYRNLAIGSGIGKLLEMMVKNEPVIADMLGKWKNPGMFGQPNYGAFTGSGKGMNYWADPRFGNRFGRPKGYRRMNKFNREKLMDGAQLWESMEVSMGPSYGLDTGL